ncbi:MAG: oxygen-independent coproporphyrinogen III oxidase [Bacteroidetes bacterium]|nr:oxygen-independent coproporphyrinogen III oxidase [Bacteroidota bacterium]
MESQDLLTKYNIPVPRYTSYPTVPYWKEGISVKDWKTVFSETFKENNRQEGISLYIHLPFCESLCTYCGCNKKITTNHRVENEYMIALLKEWDIYRALMPESPILREIHLGGGTPTFFSPENLQFLINSILQVATVHPDRNFSFEGHPNNTTREHLDTLYQLGFRRVSFGVQDNDAEVQRVINRFQPFENVQRATANAREAGYESVNFDLIYGLPHQTLESIRKTILECITLRPDRVAFYSYAHVPWASRGQRLFDENDLPSTSLKMELYKLGRQVFIENGYQDIGMDHFALPDDELHKAWGDGTLHRNFMGYTTQHTSLLLGLGVSSISDVGKAFAQNAKSIHEYYNYIEKNELPVEKGYFLSEEDLVFRKHILDMSCRGETFFNPVYKKQIESLSIPELQKLSDDGLVEFDDFHAKLTVQGRNFIRNVCRAFDLHLLRSAQTQEKKSFSKAI